MSAHKRLLILTEEASDDVAHILLVSFNQWGARQRDTYAQRLSSALDKLAAFPLIGKDHSHWKPGLRVQHVGQHNIYYRVDSDAIRVLRILHDRVDAPTHLGP